MMKKTITLAILAALSLASVSCQKEETEKTNRTNLEQDYSAYSVRYTIDGQYHAATFRTAEERQAFILQLIGMTREGHAVTIIPNQTVQSASKEKVVHETKDPKDATQWTNQMIELGYTVTVTYNQETGIYTCVAIR